MKPKILLVDDEETILEKMRMALEPDYQVLTASGEGEALKIYEKEKPPVVTLDISLNPLDGDDLGGIRLLEHMLSIDPATRVIVITGNNDNKNAVRAVQMGAFDYFNKPVRLDELKLVIGRAFYLHRLLQRVPSITQPFGHAFHGTMGASKAMKETLCSINRFALSDVPLLIRGEPGTEKARVARAIHRKSRRRKKPFLAVSCTDICGNLLAAELFGQCEGKDHPTSGITPGRLQLAHGGTLFLDELGELAPDLQVRLLRYLQCHRIEYLGGNPSIVVDTRIVASTSRDLTRDVENGTFSEQLLGQLKAAVIDLPPLRDRKEDIVPLAEFFVKSFCKHERKPPMQLSPEAQGALLMHPWPGNVRELELLISRSVGRASGGILKPSDLGFALDQIPTEGNLKLAKTAIEMGFVKNALTRNHGIVSRAARELGISRVNLYELISKYRIKLQEFKTSRAAGQSPIETREVS